MASEPAFEQAVARLAEQAAGERIALLCSEREPDACHRRLLVGKALADRGVQLRHILADGSLRSETAVAIDGLWWRSARPVRR